MENHEIREENAVLRQRVEQVESKMRELVRALEDRNQQVKEWARMYEDLQTQFLEAQDAANTQAGFVQERNKTIQKLNEMIDQLRQENYQQSNVNAKKADILRGEIYKQKMELADILERLSCAKIPAEDAFRTMSDLLDKKEAQIQELSDKFGDLAKKYETLENDIANRDAEIGHLQRENDENEEQLRILKQQLADARSGRWELIKIEELNLQIEKMRRLLQQAEREKAKLKKVGLKLKDDVKQRDAGLAQLQGSLECVMNQNVDLRERLRMQQIKTDEIAQKLSKSMENERKSNNKFQAKKTKAHNLKIRIKELEERVQKLGKKKTHIAVRRIQNLKKEGDDALKQKEEKIQLRQEIEKRLDAEQRVFDMQDEMKALREENAMIKEKYSEAKGADVQPLVELIRDLQVEAITVDSEYYELMEQVPEEPPVSSIEIPDDICESDANILARIMAHATQYEIENKELRILLDKFARAASMYHRIAAVIGKYPILSTEDIATQQDRGNWVLPADVEHLQRAVVKLHELLIRRKMDK